MGETHHVVERMAVALVRPTATRSVEPEPSEEPPGGSILEQRFVPTTFMAADVPSLIADINTANGNGVANTIDLTALLGSIS